MSGTGTGRCGAEGRIGSPGGLSVSLECVCVSPSLTRVSQDLSRVYAPSLVSPGLKEVSSEDLPDGFPECLVSPKCVVVVPGISYVLKEPSRESPPSPLPPTSLKESLCGGVPDG